jgi:hypothetical protein
MESPLSQNQQVDMGEPSRLSGAGLEEEKLQQVTLNERSSSKLQFKGLLRQIKPQDTGSGDRLLPLRLSSEERTGPIFDSQTFAPSPKNPAALINTAEVYATFR